MNKKQITTLKKLIKEMVSKEVAKQMQIVISEITNPPVKNTVSLKKSPRAFGASFQSF